MSNEEMALAIQAGETALYAALWVQTRRLLFRMVSGFARKNGELLTRHGLTLEDLQQAAFLALVFAVEQYRPEKGYLLTSYFDLALKKEIRAAFGGGERKRKVDALNHSAALDAPVYDDSDATLGELLPDPFDMEAAAADQAEREALWAAVDRLPGLRGEMIKERYRDNLPLTKVAARHGLSYSKARTENDNALRQLRRDRTLCRVFADRINLYAGTGLGSFKHSGMSSVERAYEWMEQHQEREQLRVLQAEREDLARMLAEKVL